MVTAGSPAMASGCWSTLRGGRPAGPLSPPGVEPITVPHRTSTNSVIMVTGQKLALGRAHAHTVLTVHVAEHTITVGSDRLPGWST
jgi:hypothetical protein